MGDRRRRRKKEVKEGTAYKAVYCRLCSADWFLFHPLSGKFPGGRHWTARRDGGVQGDLLHQCGTPSMKGGGGGGSSRRGIAAVPVSLPSARGPWESASLPKKKKGPFVRASLCRPGGSQLLSFSRQSTVAQCTRACVCAYFLCRLSLLYLPLCVRKWPRRKGGEDMAGIGKTR